MSQVPSFPLPPRSLWTRKSTLLAVVLFGLGWRIAVALWVYPAFRPSGPMGGDSEAYVALARNLIAGHGYSVAQAPPYEPYIHRPPTYPLFLAGTLFLSGGSEAGAVFVQVLLDLATAFVLFQLARLLWPLRPRLHMLVLALWATCPAVGSFAGRLLAEVLATFLVSCGALLLVTAIQTERRRWLFGMGAGMALMAAALARPQLAATAIALPMLVAFLPASAGRGRGRRMALLLPVLLGILLVEVPWVARNVAAVDAPVLLARGQAGRAFMIGMVETKRVETTAEVKEQLEAAGFVSDDVDTSRRQQALELARSDSKTLVLKSIRRAVLLWASPRTAVYGITPDRIRAALADPFHPASLVVVAISGLLSLYYGALLVLAVIGGVRYRRNALLASFLLAMPVAVTLVAMWFHLESRYVLPAFPAVVLAAGLAIDDALSRRWVLAKPGWVRVEKVAPWGIAGLTLAHALTLCFLFMPYLDDQPVNAYSSQRGDAFDYVERARALAADAPIAVAMADRYRMPGYPLYLSAFYRSCAEPLRAARITQVLLSSLVVPLAWIIFRALGLAALPALLATALPALWPALYYFDPILIPESLSVVLLAGLLAILAISARGHALVGGVGAAVVIALSTYLKPNHVLLVLPCCAFLACAFGGWQARAKTGLGMIAVWALLMAPWFLSQPPGTPALMALTSAQGKNLLQGTGAAVEPSTSTLHDRAARALSLSDPEAEALFQRAGDPRPLSNLQAEMGLSLWRARPAATAAYGLAKCGHALGFSGRDLRDVMNAALTIVSLAAMTWLRRRKVVGAGPWVAYYVITLAVVLGQAFVFLPNQRFKVVTFDLPALIVIALAAHAVWSSRAGAGTWVSGLSPKSLK